MTHYGTKLKLYNYRRILHNMYLLFTSSNKIGSRLIRLATGEAVSHAAVLMPDGSVAHMAFTGLKQQSISAFLKENNIVARVAVNTDPSVAVARLVAFRQQHSRLYDYSALLYLGIMLLYHRLTGIPHHLIYRNRWQKKSMDMCTEFACWMLGREVNSVITPGQLLKELRESETYEPDIH